MYVVAGSGEGTDDGRREIHAKFNVREYPLILRALREMKTKNYEIFKNIPDDEPELKTTGFVEDEDDEDDGEYEDVE